MAYTYSKIATYTVGSGGVASISFLSIPQTYTDLVLVISARPTTGSDSMLISFNGSTSSFTDRYLEGSGASVVSGTNSQSGRYLDYPLTTTVNTFDNVNVYIPNYTSSNYKSFSVDSVTEANATTAYQTLIAGLWSNTAGITSISLSFVSNNFAQYSTAHLYGIKAEL